jgi:uncharacterized protein (DUF2236 family)
MAAPSTGVGIGTAVLMQMLLPGVVRMINQSSSFKQDPGLRGRLTIEYGDTTTYGDTEAAERAGEMLRNIHSHKTAIDPDTGQEYRADSPDLLLWVQETIVWGAIHACRRWGPKLSPAEEDRFVDEQRIAARLVGIDPEAAPRSVAQLDEYFDKMSDRLAYTPDAKAVVKDQMLNAKPRSLIKIALSGEIVDLLPPEMYELYGIHRQPWERWFSSAVVRVLLAVAGTRLPYDKLLPKIRANAMEHAFGGKVRSAGQTHPTAAGTSE